MNTEIRRLLEGVSQGSVSVDDALLKLKEKPFEDIGYAKVDMHRKLRQGTAEVIYGAGKTPEQIVGIAGTMLAHGQSTILITRLPEESAAGVVQCFYPGAEGGTALTAAVLGNEVVRLYDVGVAGLHRTLSHLDDIMGASVIIAIAGMEGALASVIGGLADCPVIAVPTSVGYGASFHGLSALLSMLNSCASGVSVVNIDNGFGAGYLANMINHMNTKGER